MSEESKENEEAPPKSSAEALVVGDNNDEEEDDDTDGNRGITRTILLAVPLLIKFVVLLLIKFMTDLIVFPLLFLYRFAISTKRKVMKKFGGPPSTTKFVDKVNGEQ